MASVQAAEDSTPNAPFNAPRNSFAWVWNGKISYTKLEIASPDKAPANAGGIRILALR
ncbi:MAG: hypothetical protein ACREE0_01280 [Phenylobacterium sp.]